MPENSLSTSRGNVRGPATSEGNGKYLMAEPDNRFAIAPAKPTSLQDGEHDGLTRSGGQRSGFHTRGNLAFHLC